MSYVKVIHVQCETDAFFPLFMSIFSEPNLTRFNSDITERSYKAPTQGHLPRSILLL